MLLKVELCRFHNNVMGKILEQDKNLRSRGKNRVWAISSY